MPKSLTMWLVDIVDTSNGTLEVCGTPIDIRDVVVSILNLPYGDIKIPPPLNGRLVQNVSIQIKAEGLLPKML